MKTTVIFYLENDSNVLAVFPYQHERVGIVGCYSHIGQHSSGSVEYFNGLKRANRKQYEELKNELQSSPYNYDLIVLG